MGYAHAQYGHGVFMQTYLGMIRDKDMSLTIYLTGSLNRTLKYATRLCTRLYLWECALTWS